MCVIVHPNSVPGLFWSPRDSRANKQVKITLGAQFYACITPSMRVSRGRGEQLTGSGTTGGRRWRLEIAQMKGIGDRIDRRRYNSLR